MPRIAPLQLGRSEGLPRLSARGRQRWLAAEHSFHLSAGPSRNHAAFYIAEGLHENNPDRQVPKVEAFFRRSTRWYRSALLLISFATASSSSVATNTRSWPSPLHLGHHKKLLIPAIAPTLVTQPPTFVIAKRVTSLSLWNKGDER